MHRWVYTLTVPRYLTRKYTLTPDGWSYTFLSNCNQYFIKELELQYNTENIFLRSMTVIEKQWEHSKKTPVDTISTIKRKLIYILQHQLKNITNIPKNSYKIYFKILYLSHIRKIIIRKKCHVYKKRMRNLVESIRTKTLKITAAILSLKVYKLIISDK